MTFPIRISSKDLCIPLQIYFGNISCYIIIVAIKYNINFRIVTILSVLPSFVEKQNAFSLGNAITTRTNESDIFAVYFRKKKYNSFRLSE